MWWIIFLPSKMFVEKLSNRCRKNYFKLMLFSYALVLMASVVSAQPEFAEVIPNITVAIGRDAVLKCAVENLENYKVAWIKMDTQTLLSIHKNVITRDQRIRVTHNNLHWNLHIREVDEKDRGYYMCQVNTEPMVSQLGYLEVMVPPSILESGTSSDTVVEERSKVSLRCEASGYPIPAVTWRREDGKDINLGSYGGRRYSALRVEGEYLNISQVSREDMGAYLCIAANGVPPSVSKRIMLQVNFRPKIRVTNQLVGAASGRDVSLECRIEASPAPLTSWIRNDGLMLLNDRKYIVEEHREGYKTDMTIQIRSLTESDFAAYKCVAKNTLGEKEGFIRLYEIPPPTTVPKVTQHYEVYLPRLREQMKQNGSSSLSKNISTEHTQMDDSHQHVKGDKNLRSSISDAGTLEDTVPSRPLQRTPESGAVLARSENYYIIVYASVVLVHLFQFLYFLA